MNILILGGGGREHALAWAIRQNPKCDRLIVAPGNAGIAAIARCAELAIEDGAAVVAFCEEHAIDLVVIGPEAPLAAGVADALRAAGIAAFALGTDTAGSGRVPAGFNNVVGLKPSLGLVPARGVVERPVSARLPT